MGVQEPGPEVSVKIKEQAAEAAEERKAARTDELIRRIMVQVNDALIQWLMTQPEPRLMQYANSDALTVVVDYLTSVSDQWIRRLMRIRDVADRLGRFIGGGARGFTNPEQALKDMIYQRLAESVVGGLEQSIEANRRRRITEEIMRELDRQLGTGGDRGGEKEENKQ